MKISLGKNATDFLKEALLKAIAAEKAPEEWKFAILNLVQAIELSLKERLREEGLKLIFRNEESGEGNTVTLKEARERLEKYCGIVFEKSDTDAMKMASRWRNSIVHYQFEFTVKQVKIVFASLFGFLSDFYRKHLDGSPREYLPENLWEEAVRISAFSEVLYKRAEERIRTEGLEPSEMEWCSCCGHYTLVSERTPEGYYIDICWVCDHRPESTECYFCGEAKFEEKGERRDLGDAGFEFVCDDCWQREARADDWR